MLVQTVEKSRPKGFADVIIIGGGPAGLMAGLAASQQGARQVIILEARGEQRTRVNMLLLDAGIVADIERVGGDTTGFSPATDFTFIDAQDGQLHQFPLKPPRTDRQRRFSVFDVFPRRAPHSDVGINELETVLIDALNRTAGIQLISNARINGIEPRSDHTLIRYTREGETHFLSGEYIGVSDGARSETLKMLGSKRIGKRKLELAVLANFQQPGLGQTKYENDSRTQEILALRGATGSTVSVTLPVGSKWTGCDTKDKVQRQALATFVKNQAKKVGVEGPIASGPIITQIVLGYANRSIFNHNIFILGDALRSSTPRLGLGANWAMRDGVRFGEALRMCQSNSRWVRHFARPWFRFNSWIATHVLNFQCLMLKNNQPGFDASVTPLKSAGAISRKLKILRKQLIFRFSWRAGHGFVAIYDEDAANYSIQSARQSAAKLRKPEIWAPEIWRKLKAPERTNILRREER